MIDRDKIRVHIYDCFARFGDQCELSEGFERFAGPIAGDMSTHQVQLIQLALIEISGILFDQLRPLEGMRDEIFRELRGKSFELLTEDLFLDALRFVPFSLYIIRQTHYFDPFPGNRTL